jgi:hypothetical protein
MLLQVLSILEGSEVLKNKEVSKNTLIMLAYKICDALITRYEMAEKDVPWPDQKKLENMQNIVAELARVSVEEKYSDQWGENW